MRAHHFRTRGIVLAITVLWALAGCKWVTGQDGGSPRSIPTPSGWHEYRGNPVIGIGHTIPNMLWNDPTVLKEGGTYRMWLSGGDPRMESIRVSVYEATSTDGIEWTIDPTPRVAPSPDPNAWDGLRIETPSVIKVGDTYHIYYSGCDRVAAARGAYSIGHATSPDGVRWTKDPANPIIVHQPEDKFKWGYDGVAEPGVAYNPANRTFYLYYVSMKFDDSDPTLGRAGILLATSPDGSAFTHHTDGTGARAAVLHRNVENAKSGAWFGYSTAEVYVSGNGEFHLYCAFLVAPGGPGTARHVTLDHAVSNDGINFTVAEREFFKAGEGDWKDQHVRSPTVLETSGRLEMWFAGQTTTPYFGAGIGYATKDR